MWDYIHITTLSYNYMWHQCERGNRAAWEVYVARGPMCLVWRVELDPFGPRAPPDPPVETVAHRVAAGLPQMHAGAQAQNLWILYYSTFQRWIRWYFITKSMHKILAGVDLVIVIAPAIKHPSIDIGEWYRAYVLWSLSFQLWKTLAGACQSELWLSPSESESEM